MTWRRLHSALRDRGAPIRSASRRQCRLRGEVAEVPAARWRPPQGQHRSGQEHGRVMGRALGIVDDCCRPALVTLKQLRVDDIGLAIIGQALDGRKLRLGHGRFRLARG